jgi:hypothetical protein
MSYPTQAETSGMRFRLRGEGADLRAVVISQRGDVLAEGMLELSVRVPERASHRVFLRVVDSIRDLNGAIELVVTDATRTYRAVLTVSSDGSGLRFDTTVECPMSIWMLEWRLCGFDVDEVIIPALGGQVITREMPPEHSVAYKYPFWWNAQFAIGTRPGGGVLLRTAEVRPAMKVLRVTKSLRNDAAFDLGLAFEADAPLTATSLSASWLLQEFDGPWTSAVEMHREWMEPAFGLVPRDEHPHRPAWIDDIDFVLELWGMRADRGCPGHTFEDMIERIERFAGMHSPETTLVYLPGFAEEGIDTNAPSYDPAPKCGGAIEFKRLVDRAHELGYRVMVHTNVLAMTFAHDRFPEFEDKQVVDPFGRKQGWGMDIDGDWLAEPFFAYINPGYRAWGDLMSGTLGDLIERFSLDAIFIDQTLLAFNDSRGPNFMAGMREHIQRLQRDHPAVLFAGEGLHEQVLPALPVAQIHGLDSIADVHGMEGTAAWRKVHPVSVALFAPYTHFLPHLLTRHPSSTSFERQEAAYAQLGIPPALVLYDRDQSVQGPAIDALLERARSLRRTRHESDA